MHTHTCIYTQRRTTRKRGQESTRVTPTSDHEKLRDIIVRRAALEFYDGMYGMWVTCMYALTLE